MNSYRTVFWGLQVFSNVFPCGPSLCKKVEYPTPPPSRESRCLYYEKHGAKLYNFPIKL